MAPKTTTAFTSHSSGTKSEARSSLDGSATATWTAALDYNGDYEVYFWVNQGGYAEQARVRSEWLVPLPPGFTTRQAMAIGTATPSSWPPSHHWRLKTPFVM